MPIFAAANAHSSARPAISSSVPERLSLSAMSALRKGTTLREISVVSLNEIAVKRTRGKLTFTRADAMAAVADLRLRVLPYTAEHALRLFDLRTSC
jgi:PIN domain nuclease of toxin-antitoxin system